MISTPAQALAFVRRSKLLSVAAHLEGVPCFVEAVTGERVRGSWWSHPKGKLIFALAEAVEDSGEVLEVKVLEGKATWVARALWPELLAVVLDEVWRAARVQTLSAATRALWKKVERASRRGDPPALVKELEASLLVHCASEHTEKGRHEKRLTSWAQWARDHRVSASRRGATASLARLREFTAGTAIAL